MGGIPDFGALLLAHPGFTLSLRRVRQRAGIVCVSRIALRR